MYVNCLEIIGRNGLDARRVEHPKWEVVADAICGLERESGGGVIMEGPDGAYMGIVGERSQFVVSGDERGGRHFILAAGPADWSKWIEILVGGQPSEYAPYEIATLEIVLTVARTYFESGQCDERFRWNSKAAGMNGAVNPPMPLI